MKPMACVLVGLSAALAACADSIITSGGFSVSERRFTRDTDQLAARAAVDLGCPEPQVRFRVIAVDAGDPRRPEQLQATGCGNRATYVLIDRSTWVVNTGGGALPSTPPQE